MAVFLLASFCEVWISEASIQISDWPGSRKTHKRHTKWLANKFGSLEQDNILSFCGPSYTYLSITTPKFKFLSLGCSMLYVFEENYEGGYNLMQWLDVYPYHTFQTYLRNLKFGLMLICWNVVCVNRYRYKSVYVTTLITIQSCELVIWLIIRQPNTDHWSLF